ncbi:MAG: molecular chaperone DnaJ [Candidatus Paceibacterota bacterium]|jgi:molecular chaperone DnaJ
MKKDYYEVLGISKTASKDEIKKAFHKLAHKYHPDKKGGDEARFKEASEAYQTLSDDTKRSQYDTYGHNSAGAQGSGFQGGFGGNGQGFGFDFSGAQGFDMGDLGDIFGDFFGGGMGGRQQKRGRDISTEIRIPFKDAIFGAERDIVISKTSTCDTCSGTGGKPGTKMKKCSTCDGKGRTRQAQRTILGSVMTERVCDACHGVGQIPEEKCTTCRGSGVYNKKEEIHITIPAGIQNGQMLRMNGMGEAISHGGSGDLYIKILAENHLVFRREGANLLMDLNIKLSDALLGTEYKLETLDGPLTVKIPEGISPNEILRVKEKGVPISKSKRGDILITIHIKLPHKLSKNSRELIEKLKEEGV